ncbi:hypothetical protein [Streptomyces anandii]|uniref:hypothetical protein n=1 Tax=Streptomyces anandii TaxID=285454 RepID=UPI0037A2219A
MAGALPRPDSGEVLLGGHDIARLSAAEQARLRREAAGDAGPSRDRCRRAGCPDGCPDGRPDCGRAPGAVRCPAGPGRERSITVANRARTIRSEAASAICVHAGVWRPRGGGRGALGVATLSPATSASANAGKSVGRSTVRRGCPWAGR